MLVLAGFFSGAVPFLGAAAFEAFSSSALVVFLFSGFFAIIYSLLVRFVEELLRLLKQSQEDLVGGPEERMELVQLV